MLGPRCSLSFCLSVVALAHASSACKKVDEPVVVAPQARPEPEAPVPELWFDAQSGGDWSASMRTLQDAHFSEFDGLKAPHMPASRIEMSWEQREKVTVQGAAASHERRVERCLSYQVPKATLELYEPFFAQANARSDTLRRSPKTAVWERPGLGQSGEFISEEIMVGLQSLGPGLSVDLCGGRDFESGLAEIQATLEADWRLRPASELSKQVQATPAELVFVVEGNVFGTEVVFDLYEAKQLNALREWLRGRGFESQGGEALWSRQVGEVRVTAEVSDWDSIPVEVSVQTESPLPIV